MTQTLLARQREEELALIDRWAILAAFNTTLVNLPKKLLMRKGPGNACDWDGEQEQ